MSKMYDDAISADDRTYLYMSARSDSSSRRRCHVFLLCSFRLQILGQNINHFGMFCSQRIDYKYICSKWFLIRIEFCRRWYTYLSVRSSQVLCEEGGSRTASALWIIAKYQWNLRWWSAGEWYVISWIYFSLIGTRMYFFLKISNLDVQLQTLG